MDENNKKFGTIAVVLIFILLASNGVLFKLYITESNKVDDMQVVTGEDMTSLSLAGMGIIEFMEYHNCLVLHYINVEQSGEPVVRLDCGYNDCSGDSCVYNQRNLIE